MIKEVFIMTYESIEIIKKPDGTTESLTFSEA